MVPGRKVDVVSGRGLKPGLADEVMRDAPGRYFPLSDKALRLAAERWARSGREGRPSGEAKALNIDVLSAGLNVLGVLTGNWVI